MHFNHSAGSRLPTRLAPAPDGSQRSQRPLLENKLNDAYSKTDGWLREGGGHRHETVTEVNVVAVLR